MEKEVNLRFDDKDIMFDAFVENLADNGNFTFNNDNNFAVCFFKDIPCYLFVFAGKYECLITFGCIYATDDVCKLIENQLNDNEDGYNYHCEIDETMPERVIVTATTIIDE